MHIFHKGYFKSNKMTGNKSLNFVPSLRLLDFFLFPFTPAAGMGEGKKKNGYLCRCMLKHTNSHELGERGKGGRTKEVAAGEMRLIF
jgi:hypothetical protein